MSRDTMPRLSAATGESVDEMQRLLREITSRRKEVEGISREVEAIAAAVRRMSDQAARWLYDREAELARRRAGPREWAAAMDAADREVATWWRREMAARGLGESAGTPLH